MPKKCFPRKLPLPNAVLESRQTRQKAVFLSASYGIAIRLAVILFELLGVWLYGSASLLLDAIASLVDVFSSIALIIFIKLAARPPDRNHPFGHGRYEPLIGLQLGLMMLGLGIYLCVQQIIQSGTPHEAVLIDGKAWIFPVMAMCLLEFCYRILIRTARQQHSPALAADAMHYRIDAITSLFAAIALLFAAFTSHWGHLIDHLGAIAIALFMVVVGVLAARENLNQLMDHLPEESFFDRVKVAACRVMGVLGIEKICIQQYGPDAHVDIDIEVDPKLSVELAHQISQRVRFEIQKDWPAVRDVTVHIEPYYPGDH